MDLEQYTEPTTLVPYGSEVNSNSPKKTVLIVDEESLIVEVIAEFLSSYGCQVHGLVNGYDAIFSLGRCCYDVLICNVDLGDITAYDLFELTKAKNYTTSLLMLGSGAYGIERKLAEDFGALYLPKPIEHSALAEALAGVI